MKVFIYYQPPKGHDVYEGTRLRKTLKGACELADVTWVDNFLALPDIVHFLSPDDESKANDAHGSIGKYKMIDRVIISDDPDRSGSGTEQKRGYTSFGRAKALLFFCKESEGQDHCDDIPEEAFLHGRQISGEMYEYCHGCKKER